MDSNQNNLSEVLYSLNEKLDLIYEISSILKKTSSEVLKTDENIQVLLDKVQQIESKVFGKMKDILDIITNQENRIKSLENFLFYNSYSKN